MASQTTAGPSLLGRTSQETSHTQAGKRLACIKRNMCVCVCVSVCCTWIWGGLARKGTPCEMCQGDTLRLSVLIAGILLALLLLP